MPRTRIARFGKTVSGLAALGLLAAVPAQARDRRAPSYAEDGGSVGRNAGPAIADGLGGLAGGWIDTIGRAAANPYFRDADYFDYYRRRSYGAVRPSRR